MLTCARYRECKNDNHFILRDRTGGDAPMLDCDIPFLYRQVDS